MKTLAVLLMGILLVGCNDTVDSVEKPVGEVIFIDGSFCIFRIKIKGVDYLVNSRGGIIRESGG